MNTNETPRAETTTGSDSATTIATAAAAAPAAASESKQTEPIFPKATNLLFHSGNVVSTDRLKKRTNLNSQDELNDTLNNTIPSWLSSVDRTNFQEKKSVEIRDPGTYEKIDPAEKSDISISVKLFLNSFEPEAIDQSIRTTLNEIGADRIETLILSLPDKLFSHEELPKDLVMPLWTSVQRHIDEQTVGAAGLSDFNANYLQQLFDYLAEKNVNLTSCCKMPEDLVEFAKINNIQLTTHIDPTCILTSDSFQASIQKHLHDYDAHGWLYSWIARYTLILKGRGIVKSKGYIVSAQRELKYTK